jgi:hypothetical protein
MDEDRLVLHNQLLALFPALKLYFRPPSKIILEYPCIVYDVTKLNANYSGNNPYNKGTTYRVTAMTNLPGFTEAKKMLDIPNSVHTTSYVVDDIVHDIFNITINIT